MKVAGKMDLLDRIAVDSHIAEVHRLVKPTQVVHRVGD